MADVIAPEQVVKEDVEIPENFNGGDEEHFDGDGAATPHRCIGTPSEPGSPERPIGMCPNGNFPEMDGQNMQNVTWVPAMGWDGMDFNMPIACCGEFDSNMGVWAVQHIVDPNTGCSQWVVPIAGPDCGGCCGDDGNGGYTPCDVPPDGAAACGEEGTDPTQMGEQYNCFTAPTEEEELSLMQKRMCELERQRTQMQRSWERERESLLQELERYREVLRRYAIPAEEANDRALMPSFASKDQQMDCSAMYGYYDAYQIVADGAMQGVICGESSTVTPGDDSGCSNLENEESTSKIATQLKAMFPGRQVCNWSELEPQSDTQTSDNERRRRGGGGNGANNGSERFGKPPPEGRRRIGAMADTAVDELAAKLEAGTRSSIDERALHALQALPVASAMEALTKVENLIEAQGGACRNLSSILQSVCRKVERKGPRDAQRANKPELQASNLEVTTPSTTLPSPTDECVSKFQVTTPKAEVEAENPRTATPADSEQSDSPQPSTDVPEKAEKPEKPEKSVAMPAPTKVSNKSKRAARRARERAEGQETAVAGSDDGEARARRWADIE